MIVVYYQLIWALMEMVNFSFSLMNVVKNI